MAPLAIMNWRSLESDAHRADVQEHIRRAIRAGTIRVVPSRAGGIRIVAIPAGSSPNIDLPPTSPVE